MGEDERLVLVTCSQSSDRVIVTLSNGEILELAPAAVPTSFPKTGERISAPMLQELRAGAERKLVARRLFQILGRRLYPVTFLRDKLIREGFAQTNVDTVLESFAAENLHTDRHYAEAFCRDTIRRRPVGRRYLRAKLQRQGVPAEIVTTVVEDLIPPERELELALAAGQRRWQREPAQGGRRSEARVIRFLLSRGFSTTLARQAAQSTAPRSVTSEPLVEPEASEKEDDV